MLEQMLTALQAPGAVARTLRIIKEQRAPVAFAFLAHHSQATYSECGMPSPPVLLVERDGQPVSGERIRVLRVSPPGEEPFQTGRPVRGWVLRDGQQHVFVTPQQIPEQAIRRGLARLAKIAGQYPFMRRVRVVTRAEGKALIQSMKATQRLKLLSESVDFHIRPGRWPILKLGETGDPEAGFLVGDLKRRGVQLLVTAHGDVHAATRIRQAMIRLGELCGLSLTTNVLVRHMDQRPFRGATALPNPHTTPLLHAAYTQISSGFSLTSDEHDMIKAHGACPTYGELLPEGIYRIFGHISPSGCSFLDMGSGIGHRARSARGRCGVSRSPC